MARELEEWCLTRENVLYARELIKFSWVAGTDKVITKVALSRFFAFLLRSVFMEFLTVLNFKEDAGKKNGFGGRFLQKLNYSAFCEYRRLVFDTDKYSHASVMQMKTSSSPQILAYANAFGIGAAPSSLPPDDAETRQRFSYFPIQFSTIVTKFPRTVLNSSNEKVLAINM